MTPSRTWLVVIADLKSSRAFADADRRRVDTALRRAVARIARAHAAEFRLPLQILRGDELQAVLRPQAPALSILTHLRARVITHAGLRVQMRAGLGSGPVIKLSRKGPFESEGEAFHRARAALDAVKRAAGGLTAVGTGRGRFDALANAALGLADTAWNAWTLPQWEAVAGRLEHKLLQRLAREIGVSFQSVAKRLRAARWVELQRLVDALDRELAREAAGPGSAEID